MLPDANGYAINPLQSGVTQTYDFSYTFQGNYSLPADANAPINHMIEHSVEDFDNLGVAIWIQDEVTKEILQSTTSWIYFRNKLLWCLENPHLFLQLYPFQIFHEVLGLLVLILKYLFVYFDLYLKIMC